VVALAILLQKVWEFFKKPMTIRKFQNHYSELVHSGGGETYFEEEKNAF
jgi:hypothetical protein